MFLEIGGRVVSPILGSEFSHDQLLADLESARTRPETPPGAESADTSTESASPTQQTVLHPYTGFVRSFVEGEPTNVYGFFGPDPLLERHPDRVNVLVIGGSLALHMYRNARDVLGRELGHIAAFSGKKIDVVTLALPGFKEPQQLMALTYFLYLGAEFDVVINIDGFNEVALPFGENLPSDTFLHHPRLWRLRVSRRPGTEQILIAARIIATRQSQKSWQSFFSSPLLRWSQSALLAWKALDRHSEAEITRLHAAYRNQSETLEDQPRLGPDVDYEADDFETYFREVADSWMRASLLIQGLAAVSGFRYFHFLQPNQYVPGSKPLSPREMRTARVDGYPGEPPMLQRAYKWTVENGYPLLRERGRQLEARGIRFVDLTQIFKGTKRTLYNDLCCHLNREGYRRLARNIGRSVRRAYAAP